MSDRQVLYETKNAVAVITLVRAEQRNALSQQAIAEISQDLGHAEADPGVRAIVLTAEGERVFCSGGDLSTMSGDGFLAGHNERRRYGELLLRIQGSRKPTIARINGHALAGGLGLVLACDLAVAADHAEFGLPEIDRGLFPMMVLALLQRHLGRKRALELLLLGQRIKPQQALELGLINRVVPKEDLNRTTFELAETLAKKSVAVMALGKRAFRTAEDLPLESAIEFLAAQLSLNVCAEDAAEGVTAFLEKRPPKWADR